MCVDLVLCEHPSDAGNDFPAHLAHRYTRKYTHTVPDPPTPYGISLPHTSPTTPTCTKKMAMGVASKPSPAKTPPSLATMIRVEWSVPKG